jgi:hypothetical protein
VGEGHFVRVLNGKGIVWVFGLIDTKQESGSRHGKHKTIRKRPKDLS